MAAAIVWMLAPAQVHADAAQADVDQARALFREGNDLRDKNDLRGALAKYEAAHALVATPITALEVGRTHLQLGELVAARAALVGVTALPKKNKESQNTVAARAEAERLVKDLDERIPHVSVTVDGVPAGQVPQIEIDGVATTAASTAVDPGRHIVVVRATGVEKRSEISVAERETREVKVSLATPAPAPVLSPTPTPAIGDAPPVVGSSHPTWVWTGFGVAMVGVAVGTFAGVMTLHQTAQLQDTCPDGRCPPDQHDKLSSTHTWATISTVSFVVAGTAAVASLIGFVATPSASPQHGSVQATVGFGTLGLRGSF